MTRERPRPKTLAPNRRAGRGPLQALALSLVCAFSLSCASGGEGFWTPRNCALVGAALGGGAGAGVGVAVADAEGSGAGFGAGYAVAATGAIAGWAICKIMEEDEEEVVEEEVMEEPANTLIVQNPPELADPCEEVVTVSGVNFDVDSATLTSQGVVILDILVGKLLECPDVAVNVEAHTDDTGEPDYNQALSDERASSVLNFLTDAGVSEMRLGAEGFGERKPIADNGTEEGRAANRRVELRPVLAAE